MQTFKGIILNARDIYALANYDLPKKSEEKC